MRGSLAKVADSLVNKAYGMEDAPTCEALLGAVRGQLLSRHYLAHHLVNREDSKALATDPRAPQLEQLFDRVKPSLATNKPGSKGSNGRRCATTC